MEDALDNPFGAGCAYIHSQGKMVPIAEAFIPLTDVGFFHSDCTYDVVSVWDGSFFRLQEHLDRFEQSYQALYLQPPLSMDEIRTVLMDMVKTSRIRNAYVSFICTRGLAPKVATRDPRLYVNQFYAFCVPYVFICEDMENGLHLVVAKSTTRIPASSVDPRVKNFHWGDLIRGLYEAYERGGQSVVLSDAEGYLTEGPGFNLFCVKDGEVYTPAKGALDGITRQTIFDLAVDLGVTARSTMFRLDFLMDADEIFLTSTAGGVMPVTKLDEDIIVGDGTMGPMTRRFYEAYWKEHREDGKWSTKVVYDDA
jgi:branched-subunit amino acid aminotransferase/4-amino-4-deoxychorismate lyase